MYSTSREEEMLMKLPFVSRFKSGLMNAYCSAMQSPITQDKVKLSCNYELELALS